MKKISNILIKCIYAIYAFLWLWIITLNLFCSTKDYIWKKTFLLSNIQIIFIGGAVVCIIALTRLFRNKNISIKNININTLTVLLFVIQIYVFYNMYFTNGWDPNYIYRNADMISRGDFAELENWYFSMYPHNQGIVFLQSVLLRLNRIFGVWDLEGHFFLIAFQCILTSLTGKLLYENLRLLSCSVKYSIIGWLMYVILLGLSGWNVVTYTDMTGLIFPTAVFRIYLSLKNKKHIALKWLGIIVVAYIGSKIKPTVLIALIAIIISEAISFLYNLDFKILFDKLKIFSKILIAGCISVFLLSNIFNVAIRTTGLNIDREAEMGFLNWMMMGLNPVNDGAYYYEDQKLSHSIESKTERTKVQIQVIKERLCDYGFIGFAKHIGKKSLINFNDGTFAWGCEGRFYELIYPDKNTKTAPFLKSLYYSDGSRYIYLSTLEQFAWIGVLFSSIGIILVKRRRETVAVVLALIGIIIFDLTFEARARYVMLYVPFWIMAAIIALQSLENYVISKSKGSI